MAAESSGTALQWAAFVGFALLAVVSLWAARARPAVRPWAMGILLWALNNIAFYVAYLIVLQSVVTPLVPQWSAVTRMHGIFLAAGALLIAAGKRAGHE